ncbi:hypothetical protein [Fibrobacter sp.]
MRPPLSYFWGQSCGSGGENDEKRPISPPEITLYVPFCRENAFFPIGIRSICCFKEKKGGYFYGKFEKIACSF